MEQYSWEDVKVFMGGRFVTGIRGFEYGVERNLEFIYGEGSEPQAIGRGNKTPSCQLKILQSELEAIILSGGEPTGIPPFTVVKQYVRKGTAAIVTDVIEGVMISGWRKAMDQGATYMEITLSCTCLKIHSNVAQEVVKGKFRINLQ
jgi:hypothetical protein